ncbi:MAG TPA: TlpA disulfide reductase family protein [Aggregicoccus sp.]|nr:TlpA disulfide reductase family protein [Aggregicoccus sp.]
MRGLRALPLLLALGCAGAKPAPVRAAEPVEAASAGEGTPLEMQVARYPGGEPWQLSSDRGHVVLLDIWATWCDPCRDTLPVYTELARRYGERGLKVYALSVDEDARAIEPFLAEHALEVPILLDANAQVAEGALGVRVMPTSYLIDRRGVVRHVHEGAMGDTAGLLKRYGDEIEALLAE